MPADHINIHERYLRYVHHDLLSVIRAVDPNGALMMKDMTHATQSNHRLCFLLDCISSYLLIVSPQTKMKQCIFGSYEVNYR